MTFTLLCHVYTRVTEGEAHTLRVQVLSKHSPGWIDENYK